MSAPRLARGAMWFARRIEALAFDRYLVVGAACALVNNVILIGGDAMGLAHGILIALTWAIGCSLGYVLHAGWTFRQPRSASAYLRFMAGCALGVPIAWASLVLFAGLLALPMWQAAPLSTLAMIAYNYASARIAILWRRQSLSA